MARIVVAEKIEASGLALLREAGHEIVDLTGKGRKELLPALQTADVLLVRSGTKVDRELLGAAPKLQVVGRAGVGVDNIDVSSASARGVLVINAPTANVVSAVEQTFALLLALLRRVPEAAASLRAGRWDRAAFVGTELYGKTLGIVGLGQVGSRVASRARAFGMKVVGHDPFLPPERAGELGVRLLDLPALLAEADIVTLHATVTDKSRKLIGPDELAQMRKGAILVNVARGALVDAAALREALASGRLAGAALDVFEPEPPEAGDPLIAMTNVLATPHLGASTVEAQERVALQTLEAVRDALAGAPYVPAVNLPFRGPKDSRGAAAWMRLAERVGAFLAVLCDPRVAEITVEGWNLPEDMLRPVAVAAARGVLATHSPETVNLVNALGFARERGIAVSEILQEGFGDYAVSIRMRLRSAAGVASAEATLFSHRDARIVRVNDLPLEFRPEGAALYLENRDVPGVVGLVGTILGEAGVNIADVSLARSGDGRAAAVLVIDEPPPEVVMERLRAAPPIVRACLVQWPPS
jgi:D-3-phosphoglycerate dehydrogenase / 2-oxoglutarate reductase